MLLNMQFLFPVKNLCMASNYWILAKTSYALINSFPLQTKKGAGLAELL